MVVAQNPDTMNLPSLPKITGAILAGGRGQRMGGQDKGLVVFQDRPLVVHVLSRLCSQVQEVVVVANRHHREYQQILSAFTLPTKVVGDQLTGFLGPLAGIHAALKVATHALVLCVPCDGPNLPSDLAIQLWQAMCKSNAPLAVAEVEGRLQPTYCLVKRDLLKSLENFLLQGGRRVQTWVQEVGGHSCSFTDAHAFANLNAPEELR